MRLYTTTLVLLFQAVINVQGIDIIKLANQTIAIGNDTIKLVSKIKEAMDSSHDGCWLEAFDRRFGGLPTCGAELEQNALLCYPKCPDGYSGVGPVCWPSRIAYGRGVGKIPSNCGPNRVNELGLCYDKCNGVGIGFLCWRGWFASNRHVSFPSHDCGEGFDYDAGLCYPKCEPGFKGVGPVCWTTNTPIGRGIGSLPRHCPEERDENQLGLCYKQCLVAETEGIGPLCWAKQCPKKYPFKCGAICVDSMEECIGMNAFMVKSGVSFPIHLFSDKFVDSFLDVFKIVKVLAGWKDCLKIRKGL